MDRDYMMIGVAAVGWICFFSVSVSMLTGCAEIEGDGFVNGRGPQKPAICKEIRPNFTKCKTIEE